MTTNSTPATLPAPAAPRARRTWRSLSLSEKVAAAVTCVVAPLIGSAVSGALIGSDDPAPVAVEQWQAHSVDDQLTVSFPHPPAHDTSDVAVGAVTVHTQSWVSSNGDTQYLLARIDLPADAPVDENAAPARAAQVEAMFTQTGGTLETTETMQVAGYEALVGHGTVAGLPTHVAVFVLDHRLYTAAVGGPDVTADDLTLFTSSFRAA